MLAIIGTADELAEQADPLSLARGMADQHAKRQTLKDERQSLRDEAEQKQAAGEGAEGGEAVSVTKPDDKLKSGYRDPGMGGGGL